MPAPETTSSGPEELLPLVYDELRRLAHRFLASGGRGHTLQPTALVHEAFLRLHSGDREVSYESRLHFYRVAARAMRGVLVNHAEAKRAVKRGGSGRRLTLADVDPRSEDDALDVLALDEALTQLAEASEDLARIVELRFFAGLTIGETADAMDLSTATVERRWRVARAYLRRAMRGGEETDA